MWYKMVTFEKNLQNSVKIFFCTVTRWPGEYGLAFSVWLRRLTNHTVHAGEIGHGGIAYTQQHTL
jgi:hypothetical protein